jgi:hypothetical protein
MYSMSGDVVELPVGGVIRKKSSLVTRQAEMNRLQQLGDILGMSQLEVNAVHTDLAEQAYKSQVGLCCVFIVVLLQLLWFGSFCFCPSSF